MSLQPNESRKNFLRSIVCQGKMVIPKREVGKTLGKFRKKFSDNKLTAYECEFCGRWHIGHKRAAPERGDSK